MLIAVETVVRNYIDQMYNPMARGQHVALQTVFCDPQVRWAVGKKWKTAFDKSTTQTRCMLFVLIFAISFLANTISVEMFQALEFTCSVHYVFFWQSFFIFNIKPMSRKKRKPSGRLKLTSKRPRTSIAEDCGGLKLMSKIQ